MERPTEVQQFPEYHLAGWQNVQRFYKWSWHILSQITTDLFWTWKLIINKIIKSFSFDKIWENTIKIFGENWLRKNKSFYLTTRLAWKGFPGTNAIAYYENS